MSEEEKKLSIPRIAEAEEGGRETDKYRIVGKSCGRDRNGIFRCICGKCKLILEVHEDRYDSGDDSSHGSNGGNHSINQESATVGSSA